jgi:tetratricopeptide (TPR) repeat protein
VGGNFNRAGQQLDDLLSSVNYSKLAVMFEQGVVHFEQRSDPARPDAIDKAIAAFLAVEKTYEDVYAQLKPSSVKNIFSSIPRDQLIASLDAESILATSRQWLSASYNFAGKYDQALTWAEKAIVQAVKINSPVLTRESTFEKGKNLYFLGRYLDAEKAFDAIAYDIDNTNLVQKSWAFYFKANIAARDNRHPKALDYFERAITLDPASAVVRKAAIQYLINRHFVGDIEIALGLALRGIDYQQQGDTTFKEMASGLYQMLGMKDKTQILN